MIHFLAANKERAPFVFEPLVWATAHGDLDGLQDHQEFE
jgi:hypothetical protein